LATADWMLDTGFLLLVKPPMDRDMRNAVFPVKTLRVLKNP